MRLCAAGSCVLLLSSVLLAADNPFIGTWKLDPSKSDFSGETIKFEDAGAGKLRFTAGGQSFTIATDGKQHPGLFGRMVSLRETDPKTWERTVHFRGKELNASTLKLSDDGNTLTEVTKGTRPDGTSFENTTTYERVGSGSGITGTWKSKGEQESSPGTIEFAANGPDGLTLSIPAMKAKCSVKLDGKDYPASGPTVPSGLTLAMTRSGDRSLDMTEKIKGKPVFKTTYTVSDDGRTITSTGGSVGVNEPTKAVYDKQ